MPIISIQFFIFIFIIIIFIYFFFNKSLIENTTFQ